MIYVFSYLEEYMNMPHTRKHGRSEATFSSIFAESSVIIYKNIAILPFRSTKMSYKVAYSYYLKTCNCKGTVIKTKTRVSNKSDNYTAGNTIKTLII